MSDLLSREMVASSEGPERLARVLTGVLERAAGPGFAALLEARRRWSEWVGPELAAHARPVAYEDGVLVVEVPHAVFGQELRLRELELRRAFAAGTGRRLERIELRTERHAPGEAPRGAPATTADRTKRRTGSEPPSRSPEEPREVRDPELDALLASLRGHLREEEKS